MIYLYGNKLKNQAIQRTRDWKQYLMFKIAEYIFSKEHN